MALPNPDSPFHSWILTPEELIQGSLLSTPQKQVIQNAIHMAAMSRLNILYDPQNPIAFAQQEAEYKGVISALQNLLDVSTEYEKQFDPGLFPQNLDFPQN